MLFHRCYINNPNQTNQTVQLKKKMSSSSGIAQGLSLMIPRVFPQWIDEQKIIDVFHQQRLGRVYKVSIIRMPDSKKRSFPIYQAFIYFSAWYENEIAYNFQQRIFGSRAQARIVYDDPWFWVAFENKKRRLSNNDKRMIRLGYQAYLNEQELVAQDERLRRLENFTLVKEFPTPPAAPEPHLIWPLSEDFVMGTLGEELNLTETAMNVAESVLKEDCIMDCASSSSSTTKNWYSAQWTSYYDKQLAAAADEILGAELALTETAMNVAEAALKMDEDEDEDDDRNSINSDHIYYNNEDGDYFDDKQAAGYNSDDPMYQTDYDSQGSY
jgi:hypothetical protein